MKTLLLATAAVAAFAAAPAMAQDVVGSAGITLNHTQFEASGLGLEADTDGFAIDAGVAIPVGEAWTVTVDGAFNYIANEQTANDTTFSGRVHGSTLFGDTRVAGFIGGAEAADEQLWSGGAQVQQYMDKVTLTGSLGYETIDEFDVDAWTVGGDAAYFINPDFRVNAGAAWTTIDFSGFEADAWQANVGGEYRVPNSDLSVTAGFNHAELEDADLTIDTFTVGVRISFGGGTLQSRERAGADLGRTVAGAGGFAGSL